MKRFLEYLQEARPAWAKQKPMTAREEALGKLRYRRYASAYLRDRQIARDPGHVKGQRPRPDAQRDVLGLRRRIGPIAQRVRQETEKMETDRPWQHFKGIGMDYETEHWSQPSHPFSPENIRIGLLKNRRYKG